MCHLVMKAYNMMNQNIMINICNYNMFKQIFSASHNMRDRVQDRLTATRQLQSNNCNVQNGMPSSAV